MKGGEEVKSAKEEKRIGGKERRGEGVEKEK